MSETAETPQVDEHPVDVLMEAAETALAQGGVAQIANLGAALHVIHDGELLATTTLSEGMVSLASIPITLEQLRQMKAGLDAHEPEDHPQEEVAAAQPAPAVPAAEDEDWLTGPACTLDADGNVDPDCESCQ